MHCGIPRPSESCSCGLWTLDQKLLPSGSVRETIVTIAGKQTALRPHPWLCRVSSNDVTMTVLNNRTRGHAYPMPMRQLTGESFCPALLLCCTSCTHAEWYSQGALIGQWLARSQGRHSDRINLDLISGCLLHHWHQPATPASTSQHQPAPAPASTSLPTPSSHRARPPEPSTVHHCTVLLHLHRCTTSPVHHVHASLIPIPLSSAFSRFLLPPAASLHHPPTTLYLPVANACP